ncbi:MAG TPA: DUF1326 domain-containing protein [Gemmatimonadaceae bacterium]
MTSPSTEPHWRITGEYFENCNCDVVCPCLISPGAPLTARPTAGVCEVAFGFHIDRGTFDGASLDGLNAAMIARTPGPMAEGHWSVALYVDERGDERQRAAMQAIFSGAAGGPVGALAPLVSTVLGVRPAAITYRVDGKRRSVEIPAVMRLAVRPVASVVPGQDIWASNAHPFAPERVAMAVGDEGSTWQDYGMRWDNSGKNGHYAPIDWSNA